MNSALYEDYLARLSEGRRKDAGLILVAFLRSFNSSEEREDWTHTFLETHTYGARVRHEIYAELIFPVLLAGNKRNDAWSLYWLAGTCENLYTARGLHEQIKFKNKIDLLKDAYAIERNSSEVCEALLKSLLDYFDYASHEWPAGILWGHDGATLKQCNEIMSEVTLARELDRECAHALSIDEFESKVNQYKKRLMSNLGASNNFETR
ncbi:hypothetical protein [Bradyrhizobium sp. 27S5]|uniref:hypothetical protein n=1 Tax=Bradyrhizobium sp. 27S5 TaxID=3139728 RepID=UPI0030CD25A0